MAITKNNTRMLDGSIDLATQTTGNIDLTSKVTGVLPIANGGTGTSTVSASSSFPAGSVIYHAANTAPTGFLKADGSAVSRSTYADLFTAIGTTYGAGDGSTTFLVPDLRGEFMRGWDDSRGIDSGRSFGSTQADELKSHQHNFMGKYAISSGNSSVGGVGGADYGTTGYTTNTGGTETRPRNIALLACIKF
mgnify:CR=1 FL=1